ncbi:MAG: Rrf2 family transcriptional regulator [Candidatus Hydrogenedens sp.]|nr:Rrf2 family transcriptional regulator [Candidatus Hydrogenedens sp.]
MLNQTTVTALQALLYMMLHEDEAPHAPAELAGILGASPMYLSKIHTQLVKAGILQAQRGAKGGVMLARRPENVTLREVVEACQGKILGDYCQQHDNVKQVCAFHAAMHELQAAILGALDSKTLADLLQKPQPDAKLRPLVNCRMAPASRNSSGG